MSNRPATKGSASNRRNNLRLCAGFNLYVVLCASPAVIGLAETSAQTRRREHSQLGRDGRKSCRFGDNLALIKGSCPDFCPTRTTAGCIFIYECPQKSSTLLDISRFPQHQIPRLAPTRRSSDLSSCLVRSAFLGRDRGISIMLEMESISILTAAPLAASLSLAFFTVGCSRE